MMWRALLFQILLLPAFAAASFAQEEFGPEAERLTRACFNGSLGTDTVRECIGTAALACQENTEAGYSNLGMATCFRKEGEAWDKLLNEVYREVIAGAKVADARDGGGREAAMRVAQRAWIGFRDAECAFTYALFGDGSMRIPLGAECVMRLTAERVLDLEGTRGFMEEL